MSQRNIGYLQLGSLTNADIEFLTALSAVIHTSDSGAGLLPAIKGLIDVLKALDDATSRPGLRDLVERLIRLHRVLSASDDIPTHIRAIPDESVVSSQSWLLIMLAGGGGDVDSGRVVKQLVGVAFLSYLLRGKPMPAYRADQLHSLVGWPAMRLNHQKRWKKLVQTMVLEPTEIREAFARTRMESLIDFGVWLADLTCQVLQCSVPQAKSDEQQPMVPSAGNSDQKKVVGGDDEGTFEDGKEAATGGLVRWCFRRSIKGWSPGATGLNGWTWLSPLELQRTAKRIVQAANGDDGLIRRLAALLVLSLATSLPLKLLLRLPFVPNGDIWYDVPNGWVEWSIEALVSREAIPMAILRNGKPSIHQLGWRRWRF